MKSSLAVTPMVSASQVSRVYFLHGQNPAFGAKNSSYNNSNNNPYQNRIPNESDYNDIQIYKAKTIAQTIALTL